MQWKVLSRKETITQWINTTKRYAFFFFLYEDTKEIVALEIDPKNLRTFDKQALGH